MSLKGQLRDELRRAVAVLCRASVFEKGKGMKREEQWKMMHDMYHGLGSEGNISHVHLLSSGQGVFEDLWEYDPNSGTYHLKFMYCRQSSTPIVKGVDVTTDILAQKTFKSVELVNGRALTRAADEGIKFMKKAWAFAKQYLDAEGNPKISGDSSMEDVLNKVLDDMWVDLKRGKDDKLKLSQKRKIDRMSSDVAAELDDINVDVGDDEIGDDDPDTELKIGGEENVSHRKQDWMFAGYIAFALFAPFGENIRKNHVLEFTRFESDPPKDERKKYSRAQAQKDAEKKMRFERNHNSNGSMTAVEKLLFSTQQIQAENQNLMIQHMKRKEIQDRIAILNAEANIIRQHLEMALRRAEISKDFTRVDLLEKEFEEIRNRIKTECELTPYKFPDKMSSSNSVDLSNLSEST